MSHRFRWLGSPCWRPFCWRTQREAMMPVRWWNSVGRQIDAGETDKRIFCADCDALAASLGDWYMLEDKVWARTGLAPDAGVLCLPCCERRLGRELRVTDFAFAGESDRLAGFWPGHRMLPRRWDAYIAKDRRTQREQLAVLGKQSRENTGEKTAKWTAKSLKINNRM